LIRHEETYESAHQALSPGSPTRSPFIQLLVHARYPSLGSAYLL